MRRLSATLIIALVLCFCLHAGTVSYVYGNNISSVDMEGASRGQVFSDEGGNMLIVRKTSGNVVMFDKLISRVSYRRGSELTRRGPVFTLTAGGGTNHALARLSMTTPVYPFNPVMMAGASYGKTSGIAALVLAGVEVAVPLARLWDASSTFIQNGKFVGYGTAGVAIGSGTAFASCYGISYRHSLGILCWEAGFSWLSVLGKSTVWTPYAGVGVNF